MSIFGNWRFWLLVFMGALVYVLVFDLMLDVEYESLVLWQQLVVAWVCYNAGLGIFMACTTKIDG